MSKKVTFRRISHWCLMAYILFFCSLAQAFVSEEKVATAKSLAHYAMGQMYDLLGMTNRAVMEYEAAINFDKESYLPHLRLGTGYAKLGMLSEAANELNFVNQLKPDELQSHYLLALIYSTQKDYDKAASEYELILKNFSKSEPQNTEVYSYLGQLYYSQHKYTQAIEQFENMLKIEPDNADVMYLLGSLYLEVGKRKEAIEILRKSIAVDPEHDGSLNSLGYTFAENGENLDEAKDLIECALKIDPNNGAYLDSLGWVYYQKGDYQKALELLLKANKLLEDPVIYEHLGDVYLKLSQKDEAIKYWEGSLKLEPGQENLMKKINEAKSTQASVNSNNTKKE